MGLPKFPPSCRIFVSLTLPETKSSHPKMDGWNNILLGMAYFQSELLVLERVSIDSPKVSLVPKMAVGPASTLFTAVLGMGILLHKPYLYS